MKCYSLKEMERLDHIYKITEHFTRYDFVKKIDELNMQIRQLNGQIKACSKKSHERYKTIKGLEKRIARLNAETQKWFDMLMYELYEKER